MKTHFSLGNSVTVRFLVLSIAFTSVTPKLHAAYGTPISDANDLYQQVSADLGMPVWRVSEPFTSLWIQYPIIRYTTSAGKTVTLDMAYCQRAGNGSSAI